MQKISSGINGLDSLIDFLYIGDNVVWEVDAGTSHELFIRSFIKKSIDDAQKVIYVSFNRSPQSIVNELNAFLDPEHFIFIDCFTSGKGRNDPEFLKFYNQPADYKRILIENPADIEQFTKALNEIEDSLLPGARYVFDSLTGMQNLWGNENDTYQFFTYMCPRLFDLNTVAYWILEKDAHSQKFKANLRHITQVVFDLYRRKECFYIKALKLARRPDREAFRPHVYEIEGNNVLFSQLRKEAATDIGHRLKAARTRLGISQKELADKVGFTPSFISQIENNQISPSLNSLIQICSALGLKPGQLFDNDHLSAAQDWLLMRETIFEQPVVEQQGLKIYSVVNSPKLSLRVVVISPNTSITKHFFNNKAEEAIYILDGEISVTADGRLEKLKSGDALNFRSIFPSRWETGGVEARLLVAWSGT
ncbi:MAG: helix-turn-helix domain-containing protein [Nitrospiraceae bacterium]|nr:helix-turn-helix domain-containing protein [Nitrospiraceae bacterium]